MLRQVVLGDLFPDLARRYPDNGVLAAIEIRSKLEELHSDGAFLQSIAFAADRVLDDVCDEIPAPLTGPKGWAI